jgi:uncharacterized RDD family membrane protein YckC
MSEVPQAYSGSGPSGPRAGFWRRFAALFVDGLLVGVVTIVLGVALKGVGYLLAIVVDVIYFGYFEGSPSGQTPGKRALGIRVLDFRTGGSIGHGRAVLRFFARWLSQLVFYLGYFWMLWDREKQTWHDKIAGDVVVPVDAYPVEKWPG